MGISKKPSKMDITKKAQIFENVCAFLIVLKNQILEFQFQTELNYAEDSPV